MTSCGALWVVCEARKIEADRRNGWLCTKCPGTHYYDDIVWLPLTPDAIGF